MPGMTDHPASIVAPNPGRQLIRVDSPIAACSSIYSDAERGKSFAQRALHVPGHEKGEAAVTILMQLKNEYFGICSHWWFCSPGLPMVLPLLRPVVETLSSAIFL